MLLTEFFNFDNDADSYRRDRRYNAQRDSSVVERSDTRKIRLTLKQLNTLRMQSEVHEAEKQEELTFVKQMYGKPPEAAPA
jgi:hypothetical protein